MVQASQDENVHRPQLSGDCFTQTYELHVNKLRKSPHNYREPNWRSRTTCIEINLKHLQPDRVNFLCRLLRATLLVITVCVLSNSPYGTYHSQYWPNRDSQANGNQLAALLIGAEASLIVGDSAIEIQEVDSGNDAGQRRGLESPSHNPTNIVLDSTTEGITLGSVGSNQNHGQVHTDSSSSNIEATQKNQHQTQLSRPIALPSPVVGKGSSSQQDKHELDDSQRDADRVELGEVLPARADSDVTISGKVVDFELQPAGGHNKAKIKKKKKKKEGKESSYEKKWKKKKKEEKKAMEKKHKEGMKKKKEEGKKKKKKWGKEEHGQKKKGKFKKKKWGKKVKKGKGVKKGKKGHKKLKDKGHKSSGFKTVYHKEEYGKSSKWHDIKREKKWDEKMKKWKKKWKKEKGKKYKGEHMKKFEKKKKAGKRYKKEKKEKFKKFKKEKFKKGMKKKKEEHAKKKEGGKKKEMKEEKKKKKKKKKG